MYYQTRHSDSKVTANGMSRFGRMLNWQAYDLTGDPRSMKTSWYEQN